MEPRFSLPATTPLSSKHELVIGGVKIYIYGLDELKRPSGVGIGVLYLAHMRTRTYLVTEAIAHEVLHQYRTDARKNKRELIAVTMDMRNHGEREVSKQANLTWQDGNENHAMDLLSTISASAQDFKLILDYLPTYFPQFTHFHNIMLGISLGAHTAYRIASLLLPNQIQGFAIVVGCPTIGSLLLSRLGINASAFGTSVSELGSLSYDQLEAIMTKEQRRRWPRTLANLVQESDNMVHGGFPTDVPLLVCNGMQDPLVPTFFTEKWLEKRQANVLRRGQEANVEFFVQDNTGHSCTKEMVAMIAGWMGSMFEDKMDLIEERPLVLSESRL